MDTASQPPDPRLRLWHQVLRRAHREPADDLLAVVCTVAQEQLQVDGAAIAVWSHTGHHDLLATSGELAVMADELQYTLGEGPALSAVHEQRPVLVSNLSQVIPRWPGLAVMAAQNGIKAMFHFPVTVAGDLVAALDLYRTRPCPLNADQLSAAHALTDLVILGLACHHDQLLIRSGAIRGHYSCVDMATGMLATQLKLPVFDANARLRAHALVTSRSPRAVAEDILTGRLHLDQTSH